MITDLLAAPQLLLLASARGMAAFIVLPILRVPVPLAVRLALGAAAGWNAERWTALAEQDPGGAFALVLAGELMAGFAIGFALRMLMDTAIMLADVLTQASGFGFAALIDPSSGSLQPALAAYLLVMMQAAFLSLGGFGWLATCIHESYAAAPSMTGIDGAAVAGRLLALFATVLLEGLPIVMPLVLVLMLASLLFALINRILPQLSYFSIGLQATALLALFCLVLMGEEMSTAFADLLARFLPDLPLLIARGPAHG